MLKWAYSQGCMKQVNEGEEESLSRVEKNISFKFVKSGFTTFYAFTAKGFNLYRTTDSPDNTNIAYC